MRALVIGAGGFLGGPIRARLAAAPGTTVIAAGRSGSATRIDLTGDPADIAATLRDLAPDVVVNATGRTAGSDPELVAGNVLTTGNLVAALRISVPRARLVHLGSAAEYGAGIPGRPCRESDHASPVGVYGSAKLTATELVRASGLDAVVLRVFNPIGPHAPVATLPGRLLAELRRGGRQVHTGSLAAVRDFVDTVDVARAVHEAVISPGSLPAVINVGSGRATELRALAAGLAAAAGSGAVFVEDRAGSARSAAVPWQCADISLARAVLSWEPRIPFEESLQRMWAEAADAA
ncbi:MAG: NarL family transcriptional regulator [Actinomycetia bacterium]|jgi:nucleoside-diphosphate-sugar epimerase|nr:NarL family transcriptional regulator [Actinomycetes bacterium]MDQ1652393.1 NDP-hexose 4-ketoreductase [Cryptosporangiaceae bacterium]MDQ1658982.1 NDP-hexose 4-ketoreductase [Cryptosporangiaceae bacterium]